MSDSLFLRSIESEKLAVGAVAVVSTLASPEPRYVRLISDRQIHFAVSPAGSTAALVSDVYVPPYQEFLITLAAGEQVSIITATGETAGSAWVTVVSVI